MSSIRIKMLSESALVRFKKNIDSFYQKINLNETNEWIRSSFNGNIFVEKKIEIEDFELADNPKNENKDIDYSNSITLYEHLKDLPRYILADERFWLWLYLDKFYYVVRRMTIIKGVSTIENSWTQKQGIRRGLMFGVLSRMYYRVALTVGDSLNDKYELTKWVIDNPVRFREHSWRNYSSNYELLRGIIKGEKKAVDEYPELESKIDYPYIAKCVSIIGSVRLLDSISEEEICEMIYNKMVEIMKDE